MNSEKSIFSQLMDFLPLYEFRKCVERYNGNYKVKSFSCWDQFLCLAFAQPTLYGRLLESLRRSEQEPCIMGESFVGKIFRWNARKIGHSKWHFHVIVQTGILKGDQTVRNRTPKGEKTVQSLHKPD